MEVYINFSKRALYSRMAVVKPGTEVRSTILGLEESLELGDAKHLMGGFF